MIKTPEEIDFDTGIFEMDDTSDYNAAACFGQAASLAQVELVEVCDAEGETILVAARPVAEWLCKLMDATEPRIRYRATGGGVPLCQGCQSTDYNLLFEGLCDRCWRKLKWKIIDEGFGIKETCQDLGIIDGVLKQ